MGLGYQGLLRMAITGRISVDIAAKSGFSDDRQESITEAQNVISVDSVVNPGRVPDFVLMNKAVDDIVRKQAAPINEVRTRMRHELECFEGSRVHHGLGDPVAREGLVQLAGAESNRFQLIADQVELLVDDAGAGHDEAELRDNVCR